MRTICVASALALAFVSGCAGDDSATPTDAGGGDAIVDGGNNASLEFTAFVQRLIETETKEDNRPTTTEDKSFVDSMDPNAFRPSFFL